MKCPDDGSTLKAGRAEAHTGYGCLSCKGSWLPKSYVESLQYTKEFQPAIFFKTLPSITNKVTKSQCPTNCGALHAISEKEGVSYCPSCLGIWFESNALKNMLNMQKDKKDPEMIFDSLSVTNLTTGLFDLLSGILK